MYSIQYFSRALDCRLKKLEIGGYSAVEEWRGGVDHSVEWRVRYDSSVIGSRRGDVGNDGERELRFVVRKAGRDLCSFGLGAHHSADIKIPRKQQCEDMAAHVAVGTCK